MQLYLVETITGIYAIDEENKVKFEQTWPSEDRTIAKIMMRLEEGDDSVIGDLVSKLESLTNEAVYSNNKLLVECLRDTLNIHYEENVEAERVIKEKIAELAIDAELINEKSEYGQFSHRIMNEVTRMKVHDKLSDREALLIPAVQLLGELDTVLNSLSSRMREWYGVHFPEMGRRVNEHIDYAKIITQIGDREDITTKHLMEMTLKKKDALRIEEASQTSIGASFHEVDMNIVQKFAEKTLDLYRFRDDLIEYVSMLTEEVAPNLAFIAGPVLGAKLIEKAGGLKKIGMMPSSTIQVLGAEKAMFRAITSNAKPPKYGLLYQHPYVNNAPRGRRGNRARSLAAKIAIAARADLFSGAFIAEDLVSQLDDF